MTSPHELSASEALARMRRGALTAVELVTSCFSRIDALERTLHAWAWLDRERALEQAARVDDRRNAGEQLGALAGLPIGVKDVFNTIDMPTQMGSPLWAGFTPGNDARVVASLRRAGAIVVGKTHTAEFAVHSPSETRNPHDLTRSPGTSSSGSAVAVAAMSVPLALGTQTAGSIIRPASYCGVYGFKPSFGLIPRTGMLKTTDTLDTVGMFARTLDDLDLLLHVCRVHGADFPQSSAALDDAEFQAKAGPRWRVGLVRGPRWRDAEPYARAALEAYAQRLSAANVDVTELPLPRSLERAHDVHATIYDRTLAYYFREEFNNATLVSKVMYETITRGATISLSSYRAALTEQTQMVADIDDSFANGCDVILDLATAGEALVGLDAVDRPDHCLVWTLCGLPALSMPVNVGPSGLPLGLQLVGQKYADIRLLAFARHLSDAGLVPDAPNPRPRL